MGFRFRKSFGKGPFKVTVSKSGVGYSVGGKGLRVTKKAGGGTRTTVGIPGTGLSYVSDSKKSKSRKTTHKTSRSSKSGGTSGSLTGCLTSCIWVLGILLVIGLIAKYWKILLAIAVAAIAIYIGIKIYRKKNTEEVPEEEPSEPVSEIPELPTPEPAPVEEEL